MYLFILYIGFLILCNKRHHSEQVSYGVYAQTQKQSEYQSVPSQLSSFNYSYYIWALKSHLLYC